MSTETRRGGMLLCHDGYKYTKHKKLADGAWRWQCTDRKKKSCRGAAHADSGGSRNAPEGAHSILLTRSVASGRQKGMPPPVVFRNAVCSPCRFVCEIFLMRKFHYNPLFR